MVEVNPLSVSQAHLIVPETKFIFPLMEGLV
jgi:hypothetical protein